MSDGLFGDDELKGKEGERWTRKDTATMLNLFFGGMHPKRIAQKMERMPKAINRQLERFYDNEEDRCRKYVSQGRISRKGKRWTENDTEMVRRMRAKGVESEFIATVLSRPISELSDPMEKAEHKEKQEIASCRDLLMAYIFCDKVHRIYIVDQATQKAMEMEEGEFAGKIGNHKEFPQRIRHLALYLKMLKEDQG